MKNILNHKPQIKNMKSSAILLYSNNKVLLQLRDEHAPISPNVWGFFGGGIEKGETPRDCVIRESFEELEYRTNPNFFNKYSSDTITTYVYFEKYNNQELILHEGSSYAWFDEEDVKKEEKINEFHKSILFDFFTAMKHSTK